MDHEFDIREPVPLEDVTLRTDDVPTIRNLKKLGAWANKLFHQVNDSRTGAYTFLNSCKTMDLLAYAYVAGDKPLADWLIQQGLNPNAQYPCEWVGTKWTVSAKELQALLVSP